MIQGRHFSEFIRLLEKIHWPKHIHNLMAVPFWANLGGHTRKFAPMKIQKYGEVLLN